MAAREDGLKRVADLPDSVQLRILSLLTAGSLEVPRPASKESPARVKGNSGGDHAGSGPQNALVRGKLFHSDCRQEGGICLERPGALRAVADLVKTGVAIVDDYVGKAALSAVRAEIESYPSLHGAAMGGSFGAAVWNDEKSRGDRVAWLHEGKELANGRTAVAQVIGALQSLKPLLAEHGFDVGGKTSFQLACYPGNGARYVRHMDQSPTCPLRRITAIYYANPEWDAGSMGGHLRLYRKAKVSTIARCASPCNNAEQGSSVPVGYSAKESKETRLCQVGAHVSNLPLEEGSIRNNGKTHWKMAAEQAQVRDGQDGLEEEWLDVCPLGDRLVVFQSNMWHEVLPTYAPRYAITAWFSALAVQAPSAEKVQISEEVQVFDLLSSEDQSHPQSENLTESNVEGDIPSINEHLLLRGKLEDTLTLKKPTISGAEFQLKPCTVIPSAQTPCVNVPERKALGGVSFLRREGAEGGDKGSMEEIFVSVACFRDSECRWTIHNMLKMAEFPHRVKVGVVWQVDLLEDSQIMQLDLLGAEAGQQVRHTILDWREATGPCLARHLAQKLWQGEDFFLQIDSHMRFSPNWDSRLIKMLDEAETISPKPVISTYPPDYTGLGQAAHFSSEPQPVLLCASGFGPDGLLRVRGRRLKEQPSRPPPSLFWAAGYSFSRAALIHEVPYSPNLPFLFFGEEMAMAVRMYTHGWDFFCPSETVIAHLWSRNHRPTFQTVREDNSSASAKAVSQLQVKGLLCSRKDSAGLCSFCCDDREMGEGPSWDKAALGSYGLGGSRSVEEFAENCGVDFCRKCITERALLGGYEEDLFLNAELEAV